MTSLLPWHQVNDTVREEWFSLELVSSDTILITHGKDCPASSKQLFPDRYPCLVKDAFWPFITKHLIYFPWEGGPPPQLSLLSCSRNPNHAQKLLHLAVLNCLKLLIICSASVTFDYRWKNKKGTQLPFQQLVLCLWVKPCVGEGRKVVLGPLWGIFLTSAAATLPSSHACSLHFWLWPRGLMDSCPIWYLVGYGWEEWCGSHFPSCFSLLLPSITSPHWAEHFPECSRLNTVFPPNSCLPGTSEWDLIWKQSFADVIN